MCVRSSRVIAGFLNGEERSEAGPRPHQYLHNGNSCDRGTLRQPVAAPSDGGLTPVSPQVSPSNTTAPPADEKCRNRQQASNVVSSVKERAHSALTTPSSSGGQPLQQQQEQRRQQHQHQQQRNFSVRPRSGGSPSPPYIGQHLGGGFTGTLKDERSDPMATVTEADVRRAYATLQNRASKAPLVDHTAAGRQVMKRPPALVSSLGDCDGARDNIPSGDAAAVIQLFGVNRIGSTPSVPTGRPASPTRRGMAGCTTPLAQTNSATAYVGENIKLTERVEQPRARTPNGVYAKRSASAKGIGQQATQPSATGVPASESADDDLVALTRQHVEEVRAPPPQAVGFAVPPVEPTAIKFADGLGSWADETVAVGRLVDQDSRRMADERAGEAREEGDIRRTLERGMRTTVKTMPLRFLKDFGYLGEAQKRGLEKTTRIMERVAAVARSRAWQK